MSTRWEGHGSSVPCARVVSEEDARRAEKACWLYRRRRWVSGAQAAQVRSRKARAWLGRAREAVNGREVCGAAAKRCRCGARAAAEGRRRSGGGGEAYGRV